MAKVNKQPLHQIQRKDTLALRTAVFYDRDAVPPTTPIMVGSFVVYRKPLPRTPMTQYLIMDGTAIAGIQISYPSIADCDRAVKWFRDRHAVRHLPETLRKKAHRSRSMTIKKDRLQEAA